MSGGIPLLRAVLRRMSTIVSSLARPRTYILFEVGAALLFFGAFIHNSALEKSGGTALDELAARGYSLAADAIRVYPAKTGGAMSGVHAGGWRPGVISLRERPEGNVGPEVFLRHELMHEASFRTCGGRLPIWAEEAAAMSFSGELALDPLLRTERPGPQDLSALAGRIHSGAALDRETYRTLAQLVAIHGWPTAPCAVSESIEKELAAAGPTEDTGFAGILIHLSSARILEAKGDQKTGHPPGSLLKIPFAAALKEGDAALLGEELARSDTVALLRRRGALDIDRYRFFLSPVAEAPLGRPIAATEQELQTETFWRRYLGERDADGSFPFAANLPELARVLRASLLFRPEPFAGLSRNGFLEGSTLAAQPEEDRRTLVRLHALAKTGTVSDARDRPLIGHLMVAWPAERPVFLAIFRGFGTAGAGVLRQAAPLLDEWAARHPVEYGTVRVRLMSLLPRETWEIVDESPVFLRRNGDGSTLRVSTGGRFRILSTARKSKSERLAAGVLECSSDGQTVILETDAETYAEGVLAAEARDLPGEAKKAMAAVIIWNGVNGDHRHPESGALCDSTHCMVFLGEQEKTAAVRNVFSDLPLFGLLAHLTAEDGSQWLSFAKGGDRTWSKRVPVADLARLVGEQQILDIRRERTRSGAVTVHLYYPENEEIVPCEIFRNTIKLFSCPDSISFDRNDGAWVFSGIGEGHGEGLSMERARALAEAGRNGREIILDAYGKNSP